MTTQTPYSIGDIMLLVVSVLIGTLAFLAFSIISKKKKITLYYAILVLTINLFVTHVFSEFLKLKNMIQYKSLSQPIIAFMGLYIIEWFDSRYPKIFDSIFRKTGLELDKDSDNKKNDSELENDNLKE